MICFLRMENAVYCRLCADVVSGEFKYIFSAEDDEGLSEKINECLPITVKKRDPLPKQVCNICLQEFNQYQDFYYKVLNAEKKLQTILRQTNVLKKSTGQCIECPLCTDGSIGVKDGRIILGASMKSGRNQKKSLGHVDNECLAQMIRQELEQKKLKPVEKSPENCKNDKYEYVCFTCGEGFTTEEQISKHNCVQLSEKKKTDTKGEEGEKRSGTVDGLISEGPAQCEICGKKYKNNKRLNDHLSYCHPSIYHICELCGKQFPKKWLLTTHMRKHTGELPFKCGECDKGFISNSHLRNHVNFHHKERNLKCNICRATGFYAKQDLENHIRTKHTKERIFQCNVCSKSFMSSGVYYQHRLIHTDVRKYSCTYCNKGFRRWLALHNHLRIHNGERPFACEICGRAFRQRGDMKKHLLTQHSKKIDKK